MSDISALPGGIFKKQECLKSQILSWIDYYLKFQNWGALFLLIPKMTDNMYRKKSKMLKMTLFLARNCVLARPELELMTPNFQELFTLWITKIPEMQHFKKILYTLLFWWIELKIWAKNGHMAKMTSYWLPEKCHTLAPRRNWLTRQVSGRSPCSCKALYQVSAHANLGANHVLRHQLKALRYAGTFPKNRLSWFRGHFSETGHNKT